jgi:predicted membrane protein
MKPIYSLLFVFGLLIAGYLFVNDFTFDNISFSNYLINTLFILLLSCLAIVIGVVYLISVKRRSHYKDIMTIRQYYQYKSAR